MNALSDGQTQEMPPSFVFTFTEQQRSQFRSGALWRSWRDRYPMLFDERDEDLAVSMASPVNGGSNFYEWLSAVLLYEATGLMSMQANFIAKNHPKKRERFQQIVGPGVFDYVDSNQAGLPDLFVFPVNAVPEADWFFCEVKGGRDKQSLVQRKRFAELYHLTKRPVRLMQLNELRIFKPSVQTKEICT